MLLGNVDLSFLDDVLALRDFDLQLVDLQFFLLQLKLLRSYLVLQFLVLLMRSLNLFVKSVFLCQGVLAAKPHSVFQVRIQLQHLPLQLTHPLLLARLLAVQRHQVSRLHPPQFRLVRCIYVFQLVCLRL